MEKPEKQEVVPQSIVDLLVQEAFKRNGANLEGEYEITEAEKQEIRQLVKDLQKEVDSFLE